MMNTQVLYNLKSFSCTHSILIALYGSGMASVASKMAWHYIGSVAFESLANRRSDRPQAADSQSHLQLDHYLHAPKRLELQRAHGSVIRPCTECRERHIRRYGEDAVRAVFAGLYLETRRQRPRAFGIKSWLWRRRVADVDQAISCL